LSATVRVLTVSGGRPAVRRQLEAFVRRYRNGDGELEGKGHAREVV
jgi:hypothetical protein